MTAHRVTGRKATPQTTSPLAPNLRPCPTTIAGPRDGDATSEPLDVSPPHPKDLDSSRGRQHIASPGGAGRRCAAAFGLVSAQASVRASGEIVAAVVLGRALPWGTLHPYGDVTPMEMGECRLGKTGVRVSKCFQEMATDGGTAPQARNEAGGQRSAPRRRTPRPRSHPEKRHPASSALAAALASGVTVSPESIRASSSSRAPGSSGVTVDSVASFSTRFDTRQ